MGLYKRKGTKVWHMAFSIDGKQHQMSTGTRSKKEAYKAFGETMRKLAEGKLFTVPGGDSRSFAALMEKYLNEYSSKKAPQTHRRDKSLAAHLIEFFGNRKVTEIRPKMIAEYKRTRRAQGAAAQTVNNERALMNHAFNLAIREWEWTDTNPVSKVSKETVNNIRDRWLTTDEEERLLAASPAWLREIIVFALNTGLRQSELLDLTWDNVDLFRRTYYIGQQKNKGKDTLPLNSKALSVLQERARVRHISTNLVFYSRSGTRIMARNLVRAFQEACKRAGIENLIWHDTRRSFATRMVQRGVDPYKVQKLMRHKSPAMMQRYAHHNSESLRGGVEALEAEGYDSLYDSRRF